MDGVVLKGNSVKGMDWSKKGICTTLLLCYALHFGGCIYTVHCLWCSYDECTVNNQSIGSTYNHKELSHIVCFWSRRRITVICGSKIHEQWKDETRKINQCRNATLLSCHKQFQYLALIQIKYYLVAFYSTIITNF